ncbi:MAG: ribosome silencing factor [Fuerstiella sp.]|nr:ribosome silencing factor [Fuerstiella sp.]
MFVPILPMQVLTSVTPFVLPDSWQSFCSSLLMSDELSENVHQDPDLDFATQSAPAPRDSNVYAASLDNAINAARCADELRGQDIVVLDLTSLTSIVDFFVIVTATSQRQMHAIADDVNRLLKRDRGNARLNIEGYRTEGNWLLTDYGDVVVHIFTAEGRALYDLEQLWADAGRIDWSSKNIDNDAVKIQNSEHDTNSPKSDPDDGTPVTN